MQELWQTAPDGGLWTQVNGFKLVVQSPAADGSVRFIVLRCRSGAGAAVQPVASGHEGSVRAAMASAEKVPRIVG